MISKTPSTPSFADRVIGNTVWLLAVAAVVISPWLAAWCQPLYNNVEVLAERSITSGDSGLLILAAAIFVFLRSLSLLPLFWGGLLAGIKAPLPGAHPWLRELAVPVAVTAAVFIVINRGSGAPWNYLAPLFVLAVALILLPDLMHWYIVLPTVVLVQLFLAFMWLDLAPALARFGFGRGDLPAVIRMAADFLHAQQVLNLVSIFWFAAFFISAISVAWLTSVSIKNQRRQVELECLRAQAVETRVQKEMLTLVHDLKTPLMTIQGLSSLVAMQATNEKLGDYARRISASVDRLSEMISEILHGNVRRTVTIEQLFDYVRAHLLLDAARPAAVTFTCAPEVPRLNVNHIRMARALINLIENALMAVRDRENPQVSIAAHGTAEGRVIIQVADNGQGVEADYLSQVWEYGYSTRDGSSGLGLSFVRQVVESSGGTIELESRPRAGTTVVLGFPGVRDDDQNSHR